MIEVYFDNKVVFTGSEDEVHEYCNTHEWDYTQDDRYREFEKLCGIY